MEIPTGVDVREARLRRWMEGIDVARLLFGMSLLLLAFVYGVATAKFRLWPMAQLSEARQAFQALTRVENDSLMQGILELDSNVPAMPQTTMLAADAGTEKLLVTGGSYQLMQRCPEFGCLAWIIDRNGHVLHSWEVDLDALAATFSGAAGRVLPRNLYPIGMALQSDGGLVVTFHGRNTFPYQLGIARIARDGRIIWARLDYSHHWLVSDAAGRIYTPAMKLVNGMEYFGNSAVKVRCKVAMYASGVDVIGPDGDIERHLPIIRALDESGYRGAFYGLRDDCDPLHLNSVDLVPASIAPKLGVAPGDLLVSLREPSIIALLDARTGAIRRLVADRTAAQHSPRFLPDGSVLVFDNLGGDRATGGSRIARIDLLTGKTTTVFPQPGETQLVPFFSSDGSHLSISPDGRRTMVSLKDQGLDIEIDIASGRPIWKMEKTLDISRYLEFANVQSRQTRARFKAYGTYYVTDQQFRNAGLGRPSR